MRVYDQSKADAERAANLNELYNSTKVKKKVESDKKRAESAEKKYRRQVQKTQQLETKLFDTEMPRILSDFEDMERTRIATMKSSMEAFSRSYLDFIPTLEGCCSNINTHVQSIDPDGDVNQFILDKRTGKHKETHRTEFEEYNPQFKACVKEGSQPSSPFGSVTNSPAPQRANSQILTPAASMSSLQRNSVSNLSPVTGGTPNRDENPQNARHSVQLQSAQSMSSSNLNQYNSNPNEMLQQQQRGGSFHQQQPQQQTQQQQQYSPAPAPAPTPSAPSSGSYCRGLHDYTATQPSELSFRKGDVIKVLEKDPSGWWAGELNGKMGFFPSVEWVEEIPAPSDNTGGAPPINRTSKNMSSSYVQPPQQHQPPQQYQQPQQSQQPQQYQQPQQHQAPQQYQQPPQQSQPPPQSNFRRCKALFPMEPQNPNELALQAGDIIVIEKEADGWYLGTNSRGQRGIFPASFVILE